jgi:hypothetical protein
VDHDATQLAQAIEEGARDTIDPVQDTPGRVAIGALGTMLIER